MNRNDDQSLSIITGNVRVCLVNIAHLDLVAACVLAPDQFDWTECTLTAPICIDQREGSPC